MYTEKPPYDEMMEIVKECGAATATKLVYKHKGWFEGYREILQPLISRKHELITAKRLANGDELDTIEKELVDVRIEVKEKVQDAKDSPLETRHLNLHGERLKRSCQASEDT